MELVFTKDVRDHRGDVKFSRGTQRDYPREVWDRIAQSARMKLPEFTSSIEDLSRVALSTMVARATEPATVEAPDQGDPGSAGKTNSRKREKL